MMHAAKLPAAASCSTCGCLLARRLPGGGILPIVIGAYLDGRGALVIPCPSCNQAWHSAETGILRTASDRSDSADAA